MQLSSPAFEHGSSIDARFTCQGDNHNPPLVIEKVPEDAVSLALIMDDPDAATDPDGPGYIYDHWVVWNIAPSTKKIREDSRVKDAIEGLNSSDEYGYTGPCPPNGEHRYFFKLYALDRMLELDSDSGAEDLETAIAGHVLAQAELMGTYQKS